MSFAGHAPGSAEYRRLILGLFFAGVATFAQLYAPQAVLPQMARDLAIPPATAALSVSAATLGLAASVIGWSVVADRVGRVPVMAVGVIAATVLGLLAPFSGSIVVLLVVRGAEGVALGAVPAVALAYLAEEVGPRHAAAAAGSYIAGTTVGGLAGRIVSGLVAEGGGWRAGVWTATGLCAVAAVLFLSLAPRSQGFVPRIPGRERDAGVLARLRRLLRSPRQLALYAQGFLLMGAFVAVYNYLGFHLAAPPFALPAWFVTLLFLAYLAGTFSSPWAGVLASRIGRYPVLLGAIAVMACGALLLLASSTIAVLAGLLLFTAGFFGAHAVASGWTSVATEADSRAQASSLYYFAYYAGSSLFGWILGVVFGSAGWAWFAAIVIAMCALAALAAASALRGADPSRR
ncbi:MFS transporter [Microbacterium azadirachtae]|uniref:MFS transporter n=1 Tax=Microbacterium azadirachtae TaxID=582680 RepID=UPI00087FF680|nr:MFS transporter [Microbacterium azadirachtae]SDL16210.1 Predicted arabinose efflux permease, MFS family [Microbacterium azadirachtae]SEF46065.1 Predicted arabinose efflux permease, MFS family [Microbacterium azadirachtae]SEF46070.1 Predicted arabinose efflux permease, MFS family [Microbacterium azadirachtae]